MSGKTATKQLREMLDERGVAHSDHYLSTTWRDGHGILHLAGEPMADGSLVVDMLTPEQAIAATLGNSRAERTCKPLGTIRYDYEGGYAGFEYETELSCGHKWRDAYGDYPEYCPSCGCKVVDE